MIRLRHATAKPRATTARTDGAPRWLLLIHQLPPAPAYLRVKTGRQLLKIGAVAVKDSVYVLPNTEAAHESFAWLGKEIAAGGGEATVCESSFVGGTSNGAVEALFHEARGKDYQQLGEEARDAVKVLGKGRRSTTRKRAAARRRWHACAGGWPRSRPRLLRRARARGDRLADREPRAAAARRQPPARPAAATAAARA